MLWRFKLRQTLLRYVRRGYEVPASAQPGPTPENHERAKAILRCSCFDFSDSTFIDELEIADKHNWFEGKPPPERLVALAESQDRDALWELGFLLASDWDESTYDADLEKAFEYIRRAADLGHTTAQTEAGAAYLFGYLDQKVDPDRARGYLQGAADNGDAVAMLSLALAPPKAGQPLEDYAAERLDLELRSANGCYRDAALLVADRLYLGGRGLKRDVGLAKKIFKRIAETDGEPKTGLGLHGSINA